MTPREQSIREYLAKLTAPDSNVSLEFNCLSVADARELLEALDEERRSVAVKRQSAPLPGSMPHTVDLVVADLNERKAHGITKYGRAHQPDNGRKHLIDLYQEQLDAAVYTRAEIEERRSVSNEAIERAAQFVDELLRNLQLTNKFAKDVSDGVRLLKEPES